MKRLTIAFLILLSASCRHVGGDPLPSFDLLLKDSVTHFNTGEIPDGKPIALLYFSPDCEHCQKETEEIVKKMDSLKNVRFYFITNDPLERMIVYDKMFRLYKYDNILLGRDHKYFFSGHFKNVMPPTMVIYDEYKRERAIFNGETTASKLISFVNTL